MNTSENKPCKYVVREISATEREGGKWIEIRRIIIGVEDKEAKVIIPHPLTDFIEKKFYYRTKSLSHQKRPAEVVKQFMNYILEMIEKENEDFIELKHKGIRGLTAEHGTKFLTYCSEEYGNSFNTVKGKEMYLTHFYNFLKEQNLLEAEVKIKHKEMNYGVNKRKAVMASPFKNVKYPRRDEANTFKKKKDLLTPSNPNRLLFIREFLLTAKQYEPSIALAIAFQFFGGLRSGECMNLKASNVKKLGSGLWGENGLVLEIRDNQRELFSHLKNTDMVGVKRQRDQALLNDSIIPYLYKEHLLWRDKFTEKLNDYNKVALFLDENGKALSGQNFRKKFNKLKDIYLDLLSKTKGRVQDYKELNETIWNTHVGRGTFTNMCIESGFSVEQTAIARGDKTIGQAIHYTDIINATHNISKAIGLLDKDHMEIESVNVSDIKRSWKDVYFYGKTSG